MPSFLTATEQTVLLEIERGYGRAATGASSLLLLPGRRGCGKTFLLDCARTRLDDLGHARPMLVHDGFRRSFGSQFRIEARLRSKLGESLVEDLLGLLKCPFGSTLAMIWASLAEAREATSIRESWQEFRDRRQGTLPELVDYVCRDADVLGGQPLVLLLDDLDCAAGARAFLPAIVQNLLHPVHSDQAGALIVATCDASGRMWADLEGEPAWREGWRLLDALGPFAEIDLDAYWSAVYPRNDFDPRLCRALTAASQGVPLLLTQSARWLEETGDLYEDESGWHLQPTSPIAAEGCEVAADAHVTRALADYLRQRLLQLTAEGVLPPLALQALELAALEGECFTLEAVHRSLAAQGKLPASHVEFAAFADWVDEVLVRRSATEDVLQSGRLLTDEVFHEGEGTALYAFVLPAVREYLWGRQIQSAGVNPTTRERIRTYASSLELTYGPHRPDLAATLARLWEVAGAYDRAATWSKHGDWGSDARLIEQALAAFSSSTSPLCRLEAAHLSAWRATLAERLEPRSAVVRHWKRAVIAATEAQDEGLHLHALHGLASSYVETADYAAAMEIVEQALERTMAPEFVILRGQIHSERGEYEEAARDFQEILVGVERELRSSGALQAIQPRPIRESGEPDGPPALTVPQFHLLRRLCAVKQCLGRLAQALGQVELALERKREVLELVVVLEGEDSPETLICQDNLALALEGIGARAEARLLQEKSMAAFRRVLGEDHEDTMVAKQNFAVTLRAQGELASARELFQEVAEARLRTAGEDHPTTLVARDNLACVLVDQGDLEEARRLREDIVQRLVRSVGGRHPDTIIAKHNLAAIYLVIGEVLRARELLTEVLEWRSKRLGLHHPDTRRTALDLFGAITRTP